MPEPTNTELLAAMQAMMARLDAIEARLAGGLAVPLDARPPAPPVRMADAVDGALARAAAAGLDVEARAQAAVGMLEVLTRPDVVAGVELIGRHSDIFLGLLRILSEAPGTLELLAHTLNSYVAQRDEHGRTVEQRVVELMQLFRRATQPAVLAQVGKALDLFEQSPDLYAMVIEQLQAMVKLIIALEGDVPSRLEQGLKIMELATRPEVTAIAHEGLALVHRSPATLGRLVRVAGVALDRIEASGLDLELLTGEALDLLVLAATPENIALARRALALLARLDGTATDALDVADKVVTDLQAPGFAFEERARTGLALLERLSEPATLDAIQQLTESGIMDPAVLALLARVGGALQRTTAAGIRRRSLFSAMGAVLSPKTQVAMGFGLDFAEQLGDALQEPRQIEG